MATFDSRGTRRLTPFWSGLAIVAGLYLAFLIALIVSTAKFTTPPSTRCNTIEYERSATWHSGR